MQRSPRIASRSNCRYGRGDMSTLRALALPLACLVASIIVAGFLIAPRIVELDTTTRALRATERAQRMAAAEAEARARTIATPDLERRYGALVDAGVWDSAVRAQLRETLRDMHVAEGLHQLDYQIGVRQPATDLDADHGALLVYRTPLRVKATVLHEEALLDALTALTGRHAGLLRIDECRLRRLAERDEATPALGVECQLTAYSAALRSEAQP